VVRKGFLKLGVVVGKDAGSTGNGQRAEKENDVDEVEKGG